MHFQQQPLRKETGPLTIASEISAEGLKRKIFLRLGRDRRQRIEGAVPAKRVLAQQFLHDCSFFCVWFFLSESDSDIVVTSVITLFCVRRACVNRRKQRGKNGHYFPVTNPDTEVVDKGRVHFLQGWFCSWNWRSEFRIRSESGRTLLIDCYHSRSRCLVWPPPDSKEGC